MNTRTVTVEALLPNKEGQFTVGEYAEMRIGLQPTAKPALSVPQRAVRYDEFQRPFVWILEKAPHSHDSQSTTYTCTMHPQIEQDTPGTCSLCKMDLVPKEQPADYVARKRYVKVGLTDGERIQVHADRRQTSILTRYEESQRLHPSDLEQLMLVNARGESIPLKAVARVEYTVAPTLVERDGLRRIAFFPKMGTDAYQPLATAVIGGLLMGTVLTLIDIPIMHLLVDDLLNRLKRRLPAPRS